MTHYLPRSGSYMAAKRAGQSLKNADIRFLHQHCLAVSGLADRALRLVQRLPRVQRAVGGRDWSNLLVRATDGLGRLLTVKKGCNQPFAAVRIRLQLAGFCLL